MCNLCSFRLYTAMMPLFSCYIAYPLSPGGLLYRLKCPSRVPSPALYDMSSVIMCILLLTHNSDFLPLCLPSHLRCQLLPGRAVQGRPVAGGAGWRLRLPRRAAPSHDRHTGVCSLGFSRIAHSLYIHPLITYSTRIALCFCFLVSGSRVAVLLLSLLFTL